MTTPMFYGSVCSKNGRVLDFEVAASRVEVARILFERRPKAKTVSHCNAHLYNNTWYAAGDVRWTDRYEFERACKQNLVIETGCK